MAAIKIRHEAFFWPAALNLPENSGVKAILERHEWIKFVSAQPDLLRVDQVKEFYNSLRRDSSTGEFYASFTLFTDREHSSASTIEVNVNDLARRCFNLPHAGENPFNIFVTDTDEVTAAALIENTVIEKPLKAKVFKLTYQTLLQIIKKCFIGMLGSPDQVSQPQKQLLAALMQPCPYDWEIAHLTTLHQELKVVKTLKGV